jgi:acid stress-induced BolA-like protein IbaG/YrbA
MTMPARHTQGVAEHWQEESYAANQGQSIAASSIVEYSSNRDDEQLASASPWRPKEAYIPDMDDMISTPSPSQTRASQLRSAGSCIIMAAGCSKTHVSIDGENHHDDLDACVVCGESLQALSPDSRQQHLNDCLDAQQSSSHASDLHTSTIACSICGRDMSSWDEEWRMEHVNRCIDEKACTSSLEDDIRAPPNKRSKGLFQQHKINDTNNKARKPTLNTAATGSPESNAVRHACAHEIVDCETEAGLESSACPKPDGQACVLGADILTMLQECGIDHHASLFARNEVDREVPGRIPGFKFFLSLFSLSFLFVSFFGNRARLLSRLSPFFLCV